MNKYKMPLISVIIPFFNEERYLAQCIDSVIGQTYDNLEIILVDDGSTDKSVEISEKYLHLDNRVKRIQQKNGGLVCARKAGVAAANGEYITYVDGDDWIDQDRYSLMYEYGVKDGADIVASDVVAEYGNGISRVYANYMRGVYEGEALKQILENWIDSKHFYLVNFFHSLCKHLYRKEVLFNPQVELDNRIWMAEDTAVHMQCLLKATSFANVQGAFYHYRKDKSSMTKLSSKKNSCAELVYDTLYPLLTAHSQAKVLCQELKIYMYSILLTAEYELLMKHCRNYLFPFQKVKRGSRIVLYGSGAFGRQLISYLQREDFVDVVMVCGADYGKRLEIDGRDSIVLPPAEVKNYEYDYIVVAATHYAVCRDIVSQLTSMGIAAEKICTVDHMELLSDELLDKVLQDMRNRTLDE